jgi:hypothetical protein
MLNSPPGLSDAMDQAKMLAIIQIIEPLKRNDFHIWKQTRTGLLSFPLDINAARGHLAASIYTQMALHPHIVHIVGPTEADHAASADEVIEACALARRSIENAIGGAPDMTLDPKIENRVKELTKEAQITLNAINDLAETEVEDPLSHSETLARAVNIGILDAPQLKNNPFARGRIRTRIIDGACQAVDEDNFVIGEEQRIKQAIS